MSRTPLSPSGPTVSLTIKLPMQLLRRLQAQTRPPERKVGAVVREALEQYLARKERLRS